MKTNKSKHEYNSTNKIVSQNKIFCAHDHGTNCPSLCRQALPGSLNYFMDVNIHSKEEWSSPLWMPSLLGFQKHT